MVTRAHELNVQDIVFGKLEDSTLITSQKIAFISHKQPKAKLLIQTPEFVTETYGIPRDGPFYSTVRSRSFYKLPFCHERRQLSEELGYDAIEKFYDKLREIDAHCNSDAFRAQVFGDKNAKKYEYQPLVRTPEEDEEGEQTLHEGKVLYRPPYTKVKLDLAYETDVPRFRLFDKQQDGKKTEVQLSTFDDILQHMRYMTKHRMVIQFSRLYAMKTSSGSEKKKYGIILKVYAVECTNKTPPPRAEPIMLDLFMY
jgi:hypothetical protein